MNKKFGNNDGFTLIELLTVITLMVALSVVIGLNINKVAKKKEADKLARYEETLINAACLYADVNNKFNTTIYIRELVESGYLRSDYVHAEDLNKGINIELNNGECTKGE